MEERLKFLSQASQSLTNGGELRKLKCHLLYLRKIFLHFGKWSIPEEEKLPLSSCTHCFMEFKGTRYSLEVKSSLKPSRNMQKILAKEAADKPLNGAQKCLLNRYRETRGKRLVIKCAVCQKETEVILKKPKRDRRKKSSVNTSGGLDTGNSFKSGSKWKAISYQQPRKKKKKDQFAGLKAAAVLSVKPKRVKPKIVKP